MENLIATILAVIGLAEIYVLIYLIATPRNGRKHATVLRLEKVNVFLALFFVMTLGAFLFLNGQAYVENIVFNLKDVFGLNSGSDSEIPNVPIFTFPTASAFNAGVTTTNVIATPPPAGSPLQLVIPKLGVRVPIVFSSDTSTQGVLKSLESGVGVYPGSVLPGQRGRMIILGHSSRASWYHGDYARVFALLNQLKAGDEFTVTSGNSRYVYRVFSNQVLKPAATDAYLAQPAQGSIINLITCHPVGSAADRTVISAELISAGS